MEYYIGIVHQGGEEDGRIISTSLVEISRFTGVTERKLRYRFTEQGKTHYMQLDPWISVWVTREIVRQSRPQYKKNTERLKGGGG